MPLFTLELLAAQADRAIDRRLHIGASLADAVDSAMALLARVAVPGAAGFRLLDQSGNELHRWHPVTGSSQPAAPSAQPDARSEQSTAPASAQPVHDYVVPASEATSAPIISAMPEETFVTLGSVGPVKSNLRTLGPEDQPALETHLARHWISSMLLRANLRVGGLIDNGQPHQGTYAAAWEGATIVGLAAHYWDGSLVLQAPRALGPVVRMVVAASRRPVTAIIGPLSQVDVAVTELGLLKRWCTAGPSQILMSLDVAKFTLPECEKRNEARHRLAAPTDLDALMRWRTAVMQARAAAQTADAARTLLSQQIAVQGLYIAESVGAHSRPLATASYDVYLPDAVQIGAVRTSPKDYAYGAVAVAGAVGGAMSRGIKRIALLAEKTTHGAVASYQALGFTPIDDFGFVHVAAQASAGASARLN